MIWPSLRCGGAGVVLRSLQQHQQQCGGVVTPVMTAALQSAQQLLMQQAALAHGSSSWQPAATLLLQPNSWHSVRAMGGRSHKLSLKKENNRASWLAVQPFLRDEQQQQQQQQGDGCGVGHAGATPHARQRQQRQQQQRQQLGPVIDSALPPLPVQQEPPLYQKIGRITGPYAVAQQPCFAVLESGGSQFKVTPDDVIYHNKIPGAAVNDVLEFGKVLLLGGLGETVVGRPFIPGASVVAAVEEVFKDAKVWVFKKKKRKRYSKLYGHRSHITSLRILEVRQPSSEAVVAATAALEATAAAAATEAAGDACSVDSTGSTAGSAASDSVEGECSSDQHEQPMEQQQPGQRRKRLPLDMLPGRRHGPPAVTSVWSIKPEHASGSGGASGS